MGIGDTVTFYTHSAVSNGPDGVPVHTTDDSLAMVINEYDNGGVDLVIFPPGGPTRYARVWPYDPEDPYAVVGRDYVRPLDSDPPDFSDRFRYENDSEMAGLIAQQSKAYAAAPADKKDELRKQHIQEQKEMFKKLDEKRTKAEEAKKPKEESKTQRVEPRSEPVPKPINPEVPPGQPSTGSPATTDSPPGSVDRRT